MTRSIKKLLASAATLSLAIPAAACATAQEPAAPVTAAPAATAGPALWKVSDEDTTIYLFGTVHALKPDLQWLNPAIENAIGSADEIVTEVDMATAAQATQAAMGSAMLQGTTLRALMTDENRAEYEAALATLGVPAGTFDQFEPWFAAVTLQMLPLMKAGYDPNMGVEKVLVDAADPAVKRTALETIPQQLGFFDGLPQETQLAYLDQSAEGIAELEPMLEQMVAEWVEGDAEGLAALVQEGFSDKTMYDVLLTQRNDRWADWIVDRMAQPGTVFIAVGAGHLAGDTSVQALLSQRGVTSHRVQ